MLHSDILFKNFITILKIYILNKVYFSPIYV